MNLKQFAALKVGDKLTNDMAHSVGEVTEVTERGVRVRWGLGNSSAISFGYTVQSTAWFHWDLVEPEGDRIMVCPDCGADDPPNHKPGCTHPGAADLERHEGQLEDRARE